MNHSLGSTRWSTVLSKFGLSLVIVALFAYSLGGAGKAPLCESVFADGVPTPKIPETKISGMPIIIDGNFDELTVGTNPNCDLPAGAWAWPPLYIDEQLCEALPEEFQIVPTSSFDVLSSGNSLMMRSTSQVYTHLTNVFPTTIEEDFGATISVSFRVWIPNEVFHGCSVYMAGDHGGIGVGYQSDRGPQLMWISDGTLAYRDANFIDYVVLDQYPLDQWQQIRVDIDLVSDTFDLWWGQTENSLTLLGSGLQYRSGRLTHIDRFTVAHFWADWGDSFCYVDDIHVQVSIDCNYNGISDETEEWALNDFDSDGLTTLNDLWGIASCMSGPFSAPVSGGSCSEICLEVFDIDLDGDVDLLDYAGFLEALEAETP